MSSMGKRTFFIPAMLAFMASASAVIPSANFVETSEATAAVADINSAIVQWRQLRQGGNYSFYDYARFLNYNEGWPAETSLRAAAEKAMRPGENGALVLGFYRLKKPQSGSGWTRYADALAGAGRAADRARRLARLQVVRGVVHQPVDEVRRDRPAVALVHLGRAQLELGRPKEARETAERALAILEQDRTTAGVHLIAALTTQNQRAFCRAVGWRVVSVRIRIAPPVASRALSSSTCPSSTSTVMTAAASK